MSGSPELPAVMRERDVPAFISRQFSVHPRVAARLLERHGPPAAALSIRGVRYVTEEEVRAFLARAGFAGPSGESAR